MVRVISVHHFTSQEVTSARRSVATEIADHFLLMSAVDSHQIEVRDLDRCVKLTYKFQTIGQARQIVFSPVGRYVASLEDEGQDAAVRVYINWEDRRVDGAPIRPRIAMRVTPSLQPSADTTLDTIEFPQSEIPYRIAVCPSTGNLMIASRNILVVYAYVVKIQETSKARYVDFQDQIHVFHNFHGPREVALCEDVIACLADNEVHVFKIKLEDSCADNDDQRNLRSVSSPYSVCSDLECGNGDFFSSVEAAPFQSVTDKDNLRNGVNVSTLRRHNVTAKRQQDSEADVHLEGYVGNVVLHPDHIFLLEDDSAQRIVLPEIEHTNNEQSLNMAMPHFMEEILGPLAFGSLSSHPYVSGDVIIKVVPNNTVERNLEAEAVSLVRCKLLEGQEDHEFFHNLILKPVFRKELKVRTNPGNSHCLLRVHPLLSVHHPHLMSLTLCFTSRAEGYLYHLPGHIRKAGRGCGVQRIATYPFTGPVRKVVLEPTLMHALTLTGLETYTLRSGFHAVLEAENINNCTNACPTAVDMPVCLVGLRPFFGVRDLLVAGNRLVLLSSDKDDHLSSPEASEEKWTVYSLTLPTSIALYMDMMLLANANKILSPRGYFQLLCEAHMILRTTLHHLSWQQSISADALEDVQDKYRETCLLLANHCLFSDNNSSSEWKLCLPYYRMSCLSPEAILKQATASWEEFGSIHVLPRGILHYIRQIIFHPVCGEEDIQEQPGLTDQIIQLLGERAVNEMASIVLNSPTFRNFKTSKMRLYLKRHLEATFGLPNAEEVLAFALLCVVDDEKVVKDEESNVEMARRQLRRVPALQLSEVLIQFHPLLVDDKCFSDMAILLRNCVPETFVESLVTLIKADLYSLEDILSFFIGAFVSAASLIAPSLGSCAIVCTATHNTAMMQLFLETYFTELLDDPAATVIQLNEGQMQALHTLTRSYLTSLSVPVRFGERNMDSNLFAARHLYLDKLPPFCSSSSRVDAESPEFWCQISLLKLQSLLCSSLPDDLCKEIVVGFLKVKPCTVGAHSLRLLCSNDPEYLIPILADDHPDVLLPYAKETVEFDLMGWTLILNCLHERLSKEEKQMKHESWYAAMQEILDHLANTMTLDTFLQALPTSNPQFHEDFQGHVQMCRKNEHARKIQNLIVSTGHKHLSALTSDV